MTATFIDTNQLPKTPSPYGEFTEVLNGPLAGAQNVLATVRWLKAGETLDAAAGGKHQLIYLMDGDGRIQLGGKDYDVGKGAGVYLGPDESATVSAAGALKLFHLEVPPIPE